MNSLQQSADIMKDHHWSFGRPLRLQACLIGEALSLVKRSAMRGDINVHSLSVLQCDCEELGR